MNNRFVHIGLNPVGAVATQDPPPTWPANFNRSLEAFLSRYSRDWYRYGSQNYIIWTNADLAQLSAGITAIPGFQNVYVLATEVNLFGGYNGWMPQQFWEWLKKYRF